MPPASSLSAEVGDLLARMVHETGPIGAAIATLFVAIVGGLLLATRGSDLLGAARASAQSAQLGQQQQAFQDRLLKGVDELRADNGSLRAEVKAARAEVEALHCDVARLEVALDLARAQLRRAIDLLLAVADGRIVPHAISREELQALGRVAAEPST